MFHCGSGYKRLSGSIGSRIKRGYVRILHSLDVYMSHICMKCFCNHLWKYCIRSLSDLRCTKLKLHTAILIQRKTCPCDFQWDRPYTGFIRKQSHTYPSAYRSCLLCIFFSFFIPMNIFCTLFQTFKNTVRICSDRFQITVFIISFN